MKINPSDQVECISILLSEERFPLAFAAKMKELTVPAYGCGMSETDARKFLGGTPIVLEIHYQTGYGLFGIESEALESAHGSLVSPYTGEPLEDPDETEPLTGKAGNTLSVIRDGLAARIKSILKGYGLDGVSTADLYDNSFNINILEDPYDGNNTYTLDSVEVEKDGTLAVSGSNCFNDIRYTGDDIPTDVLAGIVDWLEENRDDLKEIAENEESD